MINHILSILPIIIKGIHTGILGFIIHYIFNLKLALSFFISFLILWILFLNVNPYDVNQNKFSILLNVPSEYRPKMSILKNTNIRNLEYPVIFKPIKCSRSSIGVVIINNLDEANKYIENNNIEDIMVQSYISYNNEIGILYEKNIKSMVIKKSNSIIRSACNGGVSCEDITHVVTPKLNNVINKISNRIPNFHVGRYDIKYKDLNSLLDGTDFFVLEANGTMGYDLRMFEGTNIIKNIYYSERWVLYRFLQGFINIVTLNGYNPIKLIQVMALTAYNTIYCKDWEKFLSMYT